jgi:hypothetical protein
MNRVLFLLFILLSSSCCGVINEKRAVFIYSEGYGGDHYASLAMEKKIKNNSVHIYNVKSIEDIDKKSKLYKKKDLYVIGQGACNKIISKSLSVYDNISCYSHIVDRNILRFVKNYNEDKNLNLFINENQSYKLPFELNPKIKVYTSSGIMPTFDMKNQDVERQFIIDKNLVNKIFQNKTFLIGGNFIDANYKKVIIDMNSYTELIKRNINNKDKNISVVLHPRFFDNCKDVNCKVDKLKNLKKNIFDIDLSSRLYISKNIHDSSKEFANIANISPNFNSIIYGVYNLKPKNVIIYTIDQCNIATDDYKNKMFGDYLVEDSDHMSMYQSSRNGKNSLMNKIVNHINQIK